MSSNELNKEIIEIIELADQIMIMKSKTASEAVKLTIQQLKKVKKKDYLDYQQKP